MMKMTLRLTSLLLALLLCCAAFLTACTNPDGKDTSTEEQASESKAPRGSYKLRYLSNGDGTCIVTGIEHTEDAANLTLVIPETSPDGEKVTGFHTDALSFSNIPFLILEEDYIAHIKTPMQEAVKRGELNEFIYKKYVEGYFFEKCLENEKTDLAKETMLLNYPITAVADVYEFAPDATDVEKATFSLLLSEHANYTSAEYFADMQKMINLARQNEIYSYSADDLPVNADAFVAINLPNTLESIDPYAFFACYSVLGNVVDNIVYFGNETNPYLMLCRTLDTSITSLVMPESVKFVGGYAFRACDKLESISIAESVKYLGISAFNGCAALKSIVIPQGVKALQDFAFKNCTSLESIVIPSSVKVLEDYVFEDADNLKSVVISHGVLFLGTGVFFDCDSLLEVVIPKSVMTMGESVFAHCSKLTHIYYEGTAEEWANIKVEIVDGDQNGELPLYYYSETQPIAAGNYWRYVDGIPTAWR